MASVARGDQAVGGATSVCLSTAASVLKSHTAATALRREGVSAIACTLSQGEGEGWGRQTGEEGN